MDTTVKIPETPELRFDEKSHIYRLDGVEIPSVSRVMEPLKASSYAGISEKTLARAADKGSSVHNSIENWLKFGIDDIPEEHRPYFDGFLEWWDEYQPEVVASEVKTYHKLMRYGGTIQCDGVPTRLHHRPRLYGQPVPEERTGRPLWQRRLPADGCGCCKGQLPRIRRQSGRHHHDNGRPVGHGGGVERSKTWTKRN